MFSEILDLRGHIIDSLILPKVLDKILLEGCDFKILEINVGHKRTDPSYARIEISAPTGEKLEAMLVRLRDHGAEVTKVKDTPASSQQPKPAA